MKKLLKIVTLHKSKGLEYNIVFAPFLDLNTKGEFRFCSFRDTKSGEYLFIDSQHLEPEQKEIMLEQTEQENRRLIYVAITRAVYKCYINRSLASYHSSSSLVPFLQHLRGTDTSLISFEQPPAVPENYYYKKPVQQLSGPAPRVNFQLTHLNWRKLSFTAIPAVIRLCLSAISLCTRYPTSTLFSGVCPGETRPGNLLHYIFENIDFADDTWWRNTRNQRFKTVYADR